MNPLSRELDVARRIAREAGRLILAMFATDFSVHDKGGGDPVTLADTLADRPATVNGPLSPVLPFNR